MIKFKVPAQFKLIRNMSIGPRVQLLTVMGTIIFVLFGLGYWFGQNLSAQYRSQEAKYVEISTIVHNLRTSAWKNQTYERDFIISPNDDSIQLINSENESIFSMLAELENAGAVLESAELSDEFVALSNLFEEVAILVKQIGYSESEGLRGALRSAVHNAEKKVNAANLDALTVKILMMRRHEKDFIIRGAEKYIGRLHDRVKEFKGLLAESGLSKSDQAEISQFIETYKNEFDAFSASKMELSHKAEALDSRYENVLHRLEELTLSSEQGAQTATDTYAALNANVLMATLLAIVGASLLLLVFGSIVGRSISIPLKKLAKNAEDLGSGKDDVQIYKDDSGTEIGVLSHALRIFQENLSKISEMTNGELTRQRALSERASMMEKLQKSFGEVVNAATAGDFSQRVSEEVNDTELAKLSNAVNVLMETVDRGVRETADVLSALANTDLSKRMEGDHDGAFLQLKNDTNRVADRLSDVVDQLKGTSQSLKNATSEILEGANDLSERTTRQAATIEETSATMEQLSETVAENSKEADRANEIADEVRSAAEKGGAIMRKANSAMERITESSSKISNIIGMIDDIAFQTNLLALNASVEAARAGEAGKGFAVVAIEVRRLAQSAAEASKDVKELIEKSAEEVGGGTKLVAQAAENLDEMLEAARRNNELMVSIASKSKSQASSIEQINLSVRDMDETTQHNAALVEQTNAAVEQTENQATELDRIVNVFVTKRQDADHMSNLSQTDEEAKWLADEETQIEHRRAG